MGCGSAVCTFCSGPSGVNVQKGGCVSEGLQSRKPDTNQNARAARRNGAVECLQSSELDTNEGARGAEQEGSPEVFTPVNWKQTKRWERRTREAERGSTASVGDGTEFRAHQNHMAYSRDRLHELVRHEIGSAISAEKHTRKLPTWRLYAVRSADKINHFARTYFARVPHLTRTDTLTSPGGYGRFPSDGRAPGLSESGA
jgi:hypothetical protein